VLRVGDPAAQNLSGANLDRQIMDFHWLADGAILADVLDGFHSRFVSYGSEGSRNDTPMFVSNPHPFVVSANGNVAFVGETATEAASCGFGTGRTRRSARRI